MKNIFLILVIFSTFSYSDSLKLTQKDIISLIKIRSLADEEMMKYTLMAIAIKESSLGKNQINNKTNDYGPFQANIKSVLKRQNLPDTPENRYIYAKKLLDDVGFATANAIVELKYWKKVHKDNWAKVWASYNTGFKYRTNTGYNYANSIFQIIKKLKLEYNL